MTTSPCEKPDIASGADLNSRRNFLAVGTAASIGAGAIGMAGFAQHAAAQETKGESILDKWVRTKKAVVGVDLTNKPMRFRDESGKAAGIGIDYLDALLKEVGAEPEYVEMPFGQTFAALAAGKFEMIGTFVTILPSRGLRGTFAGFPAHYQQNVAYLKDGFKIDRLDQLNAADRKIACQQGTSEVGMLKVTFPKAEIQTFPQMPDCFNALAAGRVDAVVTDIQNAPSIFKTFPKVTIAPGTINTVPNTFFMPHNDFKLYAFITNWLRYKASERFFQGIQDKWYALELREKYKLATVTIGPGGEPLIISPG